MLSMKNLVFKKRLVKKLVNWYINPYIIDEIVSAIKLWLLTSMRIHPVVNISWVVWYKQVREQKVKEVKLVKVEGVKKWKLEKS